MQPTMKKPFYTINSEISLLNPLRSLVHGTVDTIIVASSVKRIDHVQRYA